MSCKKHIQISKRTEIGIYTDKKMKHLNSASLKPPCCFAVSNAAIIMLFWEMSKLIIA